MWKQEKTRKNHSFDHKVIDITVDWVCFNVYLLTAFSRVRPVPDPAEKPQPFSAVGLLLTRTSQSLADMQTESYWTQLI